MAKILSDQFYDVMQSKKKPKGDAPVAQKPVMSADELLGSFAQVLREVGDRKAQADSDAFEAKLGAAIDEVRKQLEDREASAVTEMMAIVQSLRDDIGNIISEAVARDERFTKALEDERLQRDEVAMRLNTELATTRQEGVRSAEQLAAAQRGLQELHQKVAQAPQPAPAPFAPLPPQSIEFDVIRRDDGLVDRFVARLN